ncbi:VOC family protein [Paraflavitalea sp. CAU 1676]|uniref:VOC family protein n=1 Tax=Paraflavitalea sp. CAU 1676 TaxID=3032598 RepID=UPI0023DBA4B8|nr:VOC family protein [Paraflavitalea sp. CAU 1676]MDF2187786.1 VOC family protein [Paraflavitalea sp. CAU 1676]
MITKMSHTTLFVLDQDKAYDFYVNKLGFKVNTDVVMDGGDMNCEDGETPKKENGEAPKFRWLTLNPPDQPDLEIVIMPIAGLDEEATKAINLLLERGLMGAGVFHTPDCRATYEELKAKGVVFKSEPKEQFYGIECIITDGVGNWFSMTQPLQH